MKIIIEIKEMPGGRINVQTSASDLATDKEIVVGKHALGILREAFRSLPHTIALDGPQSPKIIPLPEG